MRYNLIYVVISKDLYSYCTYGNTTMKKNKIKLSEAKILLFLENADLRFRFAGYMSQKLEMEYNFLLLRLRGMKFKNWIDKTRAHNKNYYAVTQSAPMELAKEAILKQHVKKNQEVDNE